MFPPAAGGFLGAELLKIFVVPVAPVAAGVVFVLVLFAGVPVADVFPAALFPLNNPPEGVEELALFVAPPEPTPAAGVPLLPANIFLFAVLFAGWLFPAELAPGKTPVFADELPVFPVLGVLLPPVLGELLKILVVPPALVFPAKMLAGAPDVLAVLVLVALLPVPLAVLVAVGLLLVLLLALGCPKILVPPPPAPE